MKLKVPFRKSKDAEPVDPDQMSIIDHLQELRSRLIKSVIAIFVVATVIMIFNGPVFDFLLTPYCDIRPEDDCVLLATDPLDPFNALLMVSLYGGAIIALPFVMYQIGKFILPGLYPNERKVLIPFLAASVVLLLIGMVLAYLFMPRALDVLVNVAGQDRFEAFFSPKQYLGFFVKMVLAFGIAFELPVVLTFLQMIGVIQTETLRSNRRIAFVGIVILSAVVTPTGDPFTLLAIGLPMYLLYEVSILIGSRLRKRRVQRSAA